MPKIPMRALLSTMMHKSQKCKKPRKSSETTSKLSTTNTKANLSLVPKKQLNSLVYIIRFNCDETYCKVFSPSPSFFNLYYCTKSFFQILNVVVVLTLLLKLENIFYMAVTPK